MARLLLTTDWSAYAVPGGEPTLVHVHRVRLWLEDVRLDDARSALAACRAPLSARPTRNVRAS